MKQADINRAVADVTGETVTTVKRLGFLLAEPEDLLSQDDDYLGVQVIDWDELDAERYQQSHGRAEYEPAVA